MALLPVIPVVLVPLFILYKTKGSTLAKVCMHIKCYYCGLMPLKVFINKNDRKIMAANVMKFA